MLNQTAGEEEAASREHPTQEPQSVTLFSLSTSSFFKVCFWFIDHVIKRVKNARKNVFEFRSIYSRVFQKETSLISTNDSERVCLTLLPKPEASNKVFTALRNLIN